MTNQNHRKNRKRTTIYIQPTHWQMITEIAQATRRTKSETLEIAIEKLYEEEQC